MQPRLKRPLDGGRSVPEAMSSGPTDDTAPPPDPVREYRIARDAARAAREAAHEAHSPEARFFLKRHADLLERIAASRRARVPSPRVPLASAAVSAALSLL